MARHRNPNGDPRPYKDGDRWILRLEQRLPDGRVIRACGTSQKNRTECTERAQSNLDKKVAKALRDQKEGTPASSVDTWLTYWLLTKTNLKPKSRVGYQAAIDKWIVPAIGSKTLDAVTLEDAERMHQEILAVGSSRTVWGTVKTVLTQAFEDAVRRGHLERSPVVHAPRLQPKKRSEKWLSAEQAAGIIEAAPDVAEQARWTVALMLGLRQGEALALRWSDLELDGQHPVMVVNRSLSRQTGKGLVYGDTKTSQRRDLPLPLDLVNLLKRHRREQREQFLSLGVQWSEHTPVFAALRKGSAGPIDPANDRKRWLKALARAEEPHVRLHDARHTAATIMLMEGVDMYSVSKALGHSSIQTTIDTYGHLPSASLRSAFEASSKALTRPRVAKG